MSLLTTALILLAFTVLLLAARVRRVTLALVFIFLCILAGLVFKTISGLAEIFIMLVILAAILLYVILKK